MAKYLYAVFYIVAKALGICSFCVNLNVQMRLNKVSELIHNSTNHQNLDSAGVSVHFQEIVDLVIF